MKDKRLNIRMSDADISAIHERARSVNLSLTDYVTRTCLGKDIIVIDGLREVLKEQKAIGRNLNQIAALANSNAVTVFELSELVSNVSAVDGKLREILLRKKRGRWQ